MMSKRVAKHLRIRYIYEGKEVGVHLCETPAINPILVDEFRDITCSKCAIRIGKNGLMWKADEYLAKNYN